jgi:hypothetical protein
MGSEICLEAKCWEKADRGTERGELFVSIVSMSDSLVLHFQLRVGDSFWEKVTSDRHTMALFYCWNLDTHCANILRYQSCDE